MSRDVIGSKVPFRKIRSSETFPFNVPSNPSVEPFSDGGRFRIKLTILLVLLVVSVIPEGKDNSNELLSSLSSAYKEF